MFRRLTRLYYWMLARGCWCRLHAYGYSRIIIELKIMHQAALAEHNLLHHNSRYHSLHQNQDLLILIRSCSPTKDMQLKMLMRIARGASIRQYKTLSRAANLASVRDLVGVVIYILQRSKSSTSGGRFDLPSAPHVITRHSPSLQEQSLNLSHCLTSTHKTA